MKSKGSRQEKHSERRRKLAELNLLSDPKAKAVVPNRRGCVLPILGSGVTLLAAAALLHGLGL
jgi:hypothetical protein